MPSASSVPGSCDASKTLAPASTRATAAARPTECSAPITRARLPLSEKSLSPSGSGIVRFLPLKSHFVKYGAVAALQQGVEKAWIGRFDHLRFKHLTCSWLPSYSSARKYRAL